MSPRIRTIVLVASILLGPVGVTAQEHAGWEAGGSAAAAPAGGGTAFLLSARLLAPWLLLNRDDIADLFVPTAIPRFVLGAQIGSLGIGLGLNYFSVKLESESPDYYYYGGGGGGGGGGSTTFTTTTTLFLIGPSVTYKVMETPTGQAQLHLMGALVYGTGGSKQSGGGDSTNGPDETALGFDGGVMGRAVLVEGFGLDGGVALDYIQQKSHDSDADTTDTNGFLQFIGFLGLSFMI